MPLVGGGEGCGMKVADVTGVAWQQICVSSHQVLAACSQKEVTDRRTCVLGVLSLTSLTVSLFLLLFYLLKSKT